MQIELEIISVNIQRHALVVERRCAIVERQRGDAKAEQRFLPRAVRGTQLRRRNIAAAILIDPHKHLRLLHGQPIQRDFASEERNDTDGHIHTVRVKQRRRWRRFKAMQR